MNEFGVDSESTVDLIHAEVVAKEREALDVIKEDVCKWLSEVVPELRKISPSTFMERLQTGVALCKLVALVQNRTAAAMVSEKKKLNFSVPMASLSCREKAEPGSFFARDNTANFISWCRELGVEEAVSFESEGLVLHKDEKRVILCLLDVVRYAERVGISPPKLVRMEREIDELEERERERSPVPWEDKKGKEERVTETTAEVPVTPLTRPLNKDTTPTRTSKTSEVVDKEKYFSVTSDTPLQRIPQSQQTEASASSRKPIHTPSQIPIPIRGSTRTDHVHNVLLATRQLRKRLREEQEPEEDEGIVEPRHKVKKLKRSPVNASRSSSQSEKYSSSQEQGQMTKLEDMAVERRHELVDEKVCHSHLKYIKRHPAMNAGLNLVASNW